MNKEANGVYSQYVVNENGDRVIPATQRADGSWRRERKIRPGYVPQDEVPVYAPPGVRNKLTPQGTPGMEYEEETNSSPPQKTRNQKKNERKKQKRKEQKSTQESKEGNKHDDKIATKEKSVQKSARSSENENGEIERSQAMLASLKLSETGKGQEQPQSSRSQQCKEHQKPEIEGDISQEELLRKQIRSLKKKVRQCDNLRLKMESGTQLKLEEDEKLLNETIWKQQIIKLEQQLQDMGLAF
eukprot:TRINITY_DN1507_c0_g1_i2.p1 TRINITY_DN1507_c0_g1~~TRINITY_DN1507_c0_g1_i2.p1  ORF type:complete len:268 (-),score=32.85 TRINITY_DN1507_c0_g1_i2:461-1189(-)